MAKPILWRRCGRVTCIRRSIVALATTITPVIFSAAHAADGYACIDIANDAERLACYDREAGRVTPSPPVERSPDKTVDEGKIFSTPHVTGAGLTDLWELEPYTQQGTFVFREHRPMYFLPLRYSDSVNDRPFLPVESEPGNTNHRLERIEAKFQVSFKVKVLEDIFYRRADLWMGYTQQSHWQLYNHSFSTPFRETDYQPEAMLVVRTDYDIFGFKGRFLNLGLVHQSNGRSEPLSRNWNRVYLQAAFERGNFALLLKPWYRIPESRGDDDNPDISDYIGRGEAQAIYRYGEQLFSLTVRNNLRSHNNRGSAQLDWTFPLVSRLKGYVQIFSGFGESLIDYNFRQTTIGFGVSLADGI